MEKTVAAGTPTPQPPSPLPDVIKIGLTLLPLAKFALATLVSVPAAFLFGYGVRKPLGM